MNIKAEGFNGGVKWPTRLGPEAHEVFRDFCARLENIPWFLMGRSLLAFELLGQLDENDSDIDIAVQVENEAAIRSRLSDWDVVQETRTCRTHQLFYQPSGVLFDLHFFGEIPEHFGYVNQFNKWVTRPAVRFVDNPTSSGIYGTVKLPGQHETFLHDDYGPDWRKKYE